MAADPACEAPSRSLLRRVAARCGAAALEARPLGRGAPCRLWLLTPVRAPGAWVLKLRARRREASLLAGLARAGLTVPHVAGFWPGRRGADPEAPVGALCTPWIDGATPREQLARGAPAALGEWIAALHALRAVPVAPLVRRCRLPPGPAPQQAVAEVATAMARGLAVDIAPVAAHALAAAQAAAPFARAGSPVLCHGAFDPDNAVVGAGGRVTLCDWEHAHAGAAGEDLAGAALGLFASGYSALAAVATARAACASAAEQHATRFWLLAGGLAAMLSGGCGGGAPGGPRAWAAFLGVALSAPGG